jgi:hypothetical protein
LYFCGLIGKIESMRRIPLVFILFCVLMPSWSLIGQVVDKNSIIMDAANINRDSLLHLIRIRDSLLLNKHQDSINMARLIVRLEYKRDSLNAALNQSIYRQKLDSVDRMRRYISTRDHNRRTRQDFYSPIGIIENDSVRSSLKRMVDVVYEDTAFNPHPKALKYSLDHLVYHLSNDSIFFRILNANQDTIPFVLKKNKIDSVAFFVMNSSKDSAKVFMRSLDKNTLYMWVGDDLMLKHLLKKNSAPQGISINWQDPHKLRIARRAVPVPAPKLWYLRSELSMMVNQNTLINWALGGNNNVSLTTDVKAWANYAKGSLKWDNYFSFLYGVQKTELLPLRKSADRINLVSNLSHKAFKKFDYTLGSTFITQTFKGFAYPNDSVPVSRFMAPADLKISLGLTYRPNPKLTVSFSPVSGQFRFVLDTVLIDQTKWGLRNDQRMNAQLGASASIIHGTPIGKSVNLSNRLDLFSNYIDHPEMVNFDWIMAINFKVSKYIGLSVQTHTKYDNRILIPLYEIQDGKKVKVGEGKRIQFSEIFGLKFTYIL